MSRFIHPHVAITANNLEATKTFYRAIGFSIVDEILSSEKKRQVILLEKDAFQIEVFHFDTQEKNQVSHEDYMKVGLLHIALPTEDLHSLREAFIQKGLSATPIRITSIGVENFTLTDPNGITIEFIQI